MTDRNQSVPINIAAVGVAALYFAITLTLFASLNAQTDLAAKAGPGSTVTTTATGPAGLKATGTADIRAVTALYRQQASLAAARPLIQKYASSPSNAARGNTRATARAATPLSSSETQIEALIHKAAPNSTVTLPKGTFTAPAGTTLVVDKPLTIRGNDTTLVNIRFIFLRDVNLSDVTFLEKDCIFHSYEPDACSPSTPLVTVGFPGYPIRRANLSRLKMNFGRAYTGIAFGLDATSDVVIDGFEMVDNEMSAITAFGGTNVRITNGIMKGGATANVDDGVALYAVYDELNDVVVENLHADNTFDAVGIGALMYKPLRNVLVRNVTCKETAVCIYVKAGDQAPVPQGYERYSELSDVEIRDVKDSDLDGKRYLSSIWIFAKGGATARNINISELEANSRALSANTARIKIFTDADSILSNVSINNVQFVDPYGAEPGREGVPGFPLTEGVFIQALGGTGISQLQFSGIRVDGATHYGVDSEHALVEGLSIQRSEFVRMNVANASGPVFRIPYEFELDGQTIQPN